MGIPPPILNGVAPWTMGISCINMGRPAPIIKAGINPSKWPATQIMKVWGPKRTVAPKSILFTILQQSLVNDLEKKNHFQKEHQQKGYGQPQILSQSTGWSGQILSLVMSLILLLLLSVRNFPKQCHGRCRKLPKPQSRRRERGPAGQNGEMIGI